MSSHVIFARDGYRCRNCGAEDDLTIDHIIPRSRGGSNRNSNKQTLCRPCNMGKGSKMPGEPYEPMAVRPEKPTPRTKVRKRLAPASMSMSDLQPAVRRALRLTEPSRSA